MSNTEFADAGADMSGGMESAAPVSDIHEEGPAVNGGGIDVLAEDAPPQSWPREVAERHWQNLDPEVRRFALERERQIHDGFTSKGHELAELRAQLEQWQARPDHYTPIVERFREHLPALQSMEPHVAIEHALAAAHAIESNPARALSQLAQDYGIQPEQLLPPAYRKYVEGLESQVTELNTQRATRALEEFKKGKEDYYDEIRPEFIKDIQEVRKGAPGLGDAAILKLAWERTLERTGTAEKVAAKEREKQDKEQLREAARIAREAKRSGSINVKTDRGNVPNPVTIDDDLRAIARKKFPNWKG